MFLLKRLESLEHIISKLHMQTSLELAGVIDSLGLFGRPEAGSTKG